jgi:hypothetical protein
VPAPAAAARITKNTAACFAKKTSVNNACALYPRGRRSVSRGGAEEVSPCHTLFASASCPPSG